jgi:hypothetical protein
MGIFVYLLLLIWQRVELRERNGRIEDLEQDLQELRTDAALLELELDRRAGYLVVQDTAEEWGMRPAASHQRFVLASITRPASSEPSEASGLGALAEQIRTSLSGGVAQARPSESGEPDAPAPR